MKKKEIIFVSNFLGNGGAARVIMTLAEALLVDGYCVKVITFPFNGAEYPKSKDIEYVTLNVTGRGFNRKISRIRLLRGEFVKSPDAVIISFEYFINMQVILAALGLKNRIIVSERNDPARVGGEFPTNILRNVLYNLCDVLVCQTPDAKSYFPKRIRERAFVIPNPIKGGLPEVWNGIRTHEIVNFCRLERQKNLPLLIDAFEKIHAVHTDYSLHIYGDGTEKENLKQYIVSKNLQDYAFIHSPIDNIHERILKCAMFVSSSDYEGLSNSMLEAMAIGLPTICTDCPCGGARMVINTGENGILVPVGDSNALYSAMNDVITSIDYSKKISRNASEIRKILHINTIVNEWKLVLK